MKIKRTKTVEKKTEDEKGACKLGTHIDKLTVEIALMR